MPGPHSHAVIQKNTAYSPNTQKFVFAIAEMAQSIIQDYKSKPLSPVIMLDGPAGVGKSTFAQDLERRMQELGINVCFFSQDRFGIFRDIRARNKINPCSDLARDPTTVNKLKQVMEKKTALVPSYNTETGVRIKDAVPLKSGDIILYEGISSLSSVIYDQLDQAYQDALVIKIFLRADSSETLYHARLKRDNEERHVDPLDFMARWDDHERNNWVYTMRGIVNANFILTRQSDHSFQLDYIRKIPTVCTWKLLETEPFIKKLKKERRQILTQNLDRWFTQYHTALFTAFSLENQLTGFMDSKVLLKKRDQLIDLFLTNTPTNTHPSCMSVTDDLLTIPQGLSRAFYNALKRKIPYSQDDMTLLDQRRYGNLFQQSLLHDARFNHKDKLGAENALAAIVIDHFYAIRPAIQKVTDKLLMRFEPLAQKFLAGKATPEEIKIIQFIISPFFPQTPDVELSRMLTSEPASEKKVLSWLLNTLKLEEPIDDLILFISIRFHIRIMHLIAEQNHAHAKEATPPLTPEFFEAEWITEIKKLNAEFRKPCIFDPTKKRGRLTIERNKQEKLTTSFGTYTDIQDLRPEFRQLMGLRSLPLHSAGKEYIVAISSTPHNSAARSHDIPLISSGSGAMPFLLCAAIFAELKDEDLKMYHLACITNMIAGGHHSLAECLDVSQAYIDFEDSTIQSLIPDSLQSLTPFRHLIELTHRLKLHPLWLDMKQLTRENGSCEQQP